MLEEREGLALVAPSKILLAVPVPQAALHTEAPRGQVAAEGWALPASEGEEHPQEDMMPDEHQQLQ